MKIISYIQYKYYSDKDSHMFVPLNFIYGDSDVLNSFRLSIIMEQNEQASQDFHTLSED